MWYPNDSYDVRPVQASFSLATESRAPDYHESMLVNRFEDLSDLDAGIEFGFRSAIYLDGSVSLLFRGEECLGADYWVEFHAATNLWRLLCEEAQDQVRLNQSSSQAVTFSSESGTIRVERKLGTGSDRHWHFPTAELVREWVLMSARIMRLRGELGDPRGLQFIGDPTSYFRCEAHGVHGERWADRVHVLGPDRGRTHRSDESPRLGRQRDSTT